MRRLGLGTFGLWGLAISLTDWLQLFDFGLREAILKFTAAHQARSDARAVRRLADAALFFYCLAAAPVLVVGAWLVGFGLPLLVTDPSELESVRGAVILLVLSVTISFPAGAMGTLLEGLARFDLINLFRTGHAILRVILIVLALQFDLGLFGVALAEVLARLVLHLTRWVAVYRIDPAIVPRPHPHREDLQKLVGFGFWSALRHVAEVAAAKVYEPMLAALAGLPSVGAFYAGRRLATTSAEVVVPLAGVLVPLSSEMDAAGRRSALQKTLMTSTKVALIVGLPIALVLGLGARPILENWLGGRAPEAESVLMVFSAVFLLVAVFMPSEAMLLGLGHTRLLALVGLSQVALSVGLGVPLTRAMGSVGLALAALIGVALTQTAVLIPIAARRCRLPFGQLVRQALLPPLLAGAPAAGALLLLRAPIAFGGLAALGAWAVGGCAIYALLLWWIGFNDEERSLLRLQFNRLLLDSSRVTDWDETR